MLKSLQKALKVKEVRDRLLFTLLMLIVIRFGSNLPTPGVNTDYLKNFFERQRQGTGNVFNFFNTITGGSLEQMSVLALSITSYITSSIIMELMTITIPQLGELQREGEGGRKKMLSYTRYLTVALALIRSIVMAVGFGNQGLLTHFTLKSVFVTIAAMTAGSVFLMWIDERITEKGVGNGISIVLLVNILSSILSDFAALWEHLIMNVESPATAVVAGLIIMAFILLMTIFVVLLCDTERHIPVQYTAKMQGRGMISNRQSSEIPLGVNTVGVIPVIFASSIVSMPVVIAQSFNVDYANIPGKITMVLNSPNWLKLERLAYSVGLVLYTVPIILFACFYASITFNPLEVANNMEKSGGFIPGIRPGRSTSDYLSEVLKYVIFLGATGLTIVAVIPIFISGVFNIGSLMFTGNSLIIIIGVILKTLKSIESVTLVKNYRGFLGNQRRARRPAGKFVRRMLYVAMDTLAKEKTVKIVMFGAPGAGKGTQAKRITDYYRIPHISTGDISRANIKAGTPPGLEAKRYTDAGGLVLDEVTIGMLKDRIHEADYGEGYVLDGFSRTIPQAEALIGALTAKGTKIDEAVDIEVPDEAIIDRTEGRRSCPNCDEDYHARYRAPKTENIYGACGHAFVQRADDKPETVAARLRVYHEQTKPLIDYYRGQGVLWEVNDTQEMGEVFEVIKALF